MAIRLQPTPAAVSAVLATLLVGGLVSASHFTHNVKPAPKHNNPPAVVTQKADNVTSPAIIPVAPTAAVLSKPNVNTPAANVTAPAGTPTPQVPTQQPGYVETCPDGTPAQGSCETPEGPKGRNVCYHGKGGEEPAPHDIYCWAVNTEANPDGGYNYYCDYLYYDGTSSRAFRGTLPDNTQGMACKP